VKVRPLRRFRATTLHLVSSEQTRRAIAR